ncbi:MAG TPA: HEAT repeat domain-containing protein [Candidatus Sulfotelmatobacter sp.]|nr:HEAT repeat domain-containing protein [Candidatus Sulfotelmatobacter sp.]
MGPLRRLVVLAMALLCAGTARGQMQGRISMAKDVYVAGEPVFVLFEFSNTGSEPLQYSSADPYAEGCRAYRIEVSSGARLEHPSCQPHAPAECNGSSEVISGGETQHKLVLVNFSHKLATPGEYEIHATQILRYAPASGALDSSNNGKELKVEARFSIRLLKSNTEALQRIYQPYVTNLTSQDDEIQREAELAIVSGAPPWLEDTIVGMLRKYTSRDLALLGLRNLNTPRAREELAKIVQSSSEYTQENEAAVSYLAQMGDKKYFPLLLEIAKRQPAKEGRDYVLAAAELGGDEAVPYLRGMLSSSDPDARGNAVAGLSKTGSRQAVPLLVESLQQGNTNLGKAALDGLTDLTHRSAFAVDDPPAEEYSKWQAWWSANGTNAPVYGPEECGEVEKLP